MSGAAFFDVDRTLLSRSSSLALAGTFRRRGLIGRRQLARALVAQLVFARFGAGHARTGQTAERAAEVLRGLRVETLRAIVEEAFDGVLRPLVYRDALELARAHAERGERTFIVTGALEEIAGVLARELGFDGALGSRAEIADGAYTGRLLRKLYGPAKADALAELARAEGLDLGASSGYSDSHTDLAFLEAVGNPVAVNPDRELRRIASERGWPVKRFREKAYAVP